MANIQYLLGRALYQGLSGGEPVANLRKAIDAFAAALRVWTEKDYPDGWAGTQYLLGKAYLELPTGDGAENLRHAKACFESALRVYTENKFPSEHIDTAENLAKVEQQLHSLSSE